MKKAIFLALCLLCASAPARPSDLPPAPHVEANAYLVLDYNSGQILLSRHADERIEPASLTRLMSAYIVFDALKQKAIKPNQKITVSEKASHAEGPRMFIEPKMAVTVDQLLHGMIVESGNDACIALAEGVAGSEQAFVEKMNREAQHLGMKNTHFTNATGLPSPDHYTTARTSRPFRLRSSGTSPNTTPSSRSGSTPGTALPSPTGTGCCGWTPTSTGWKPGMAEQPATASSPR